MTPNKCKNMSQIPMCEHLSDDGDVQIRGMQSSRGRMVRGHQSCPATEHVNSLLFSLCSGYVIAQLRPIKLLAKILGKEGITLNGKQKT